MRASATCSLLCATLLSLSLSGFGQSGQGQDHQSQPPNPSAQANLVNVFFAVRDKRGSLVPDLTREEFEILENGQPQSIQDFSAKPASRTLGILIDSSASMQNLLSAEESSTIGFLRQTLTRKDLAFVISFDVNVDLLQDLTNDTRLLTNGISKARITMSAGPAIGGHPRGTLLFDAVYLAADEVLSKQADRRAMVILTDGDDRGSKMNLRDVIEAAQKANTVCYVLRLSDPRYQSNDSGMKELADQTGGRMIEVGHPDKLGEAFSQIADELRNEYRLGYAPEHGQHDGTLRRIEIKSKSGYKVEAAKGYYAPAN